MSVKALKQFALDHYEDGGHWVYETHEDGDYELILSSFNTLEEAKQDLREYWEAMNECEQECAFE